MKCREIIEKLEELSPPSFAEDWDNVGLLAGNTEKDIEKIAIALDATAQVIEGAVKCGADMLITHHPLIFRPMKRVTNTDFVGNRILKLLQNDISYYAMHTNFDVMGMADAAADEIALRDRQVLEITYEDEIAKEGCGRYGKLPRSMSLKECAEYVKEVFQLESVKVFGDFDRTIVNAAILPGSGGDKMTLALQAGAEVMITGDVKHNDAIDAVEQGLCIIDAGHFGLEKIFSAYIREFLGRECAAVITHIIPEQNPFRII